MSTVELVRLPTISSMHIKQDVKHIMQSSRCWLLKLNQAFKIDNIKIKINLMDIKGRQVVDAQHEVRQSYQAQQPLLVTQTKSSV